MAKKYEVDGKYFLPVTVFTTDARSINPIGVQYVFASNGSKGTTYLDDYPDLLLTAEEIYASRQTADKIEYLTDMLDYGRKKYDEIAELKSRNAELEALLKEVMATRDEAIKQNDELITKNNELEDANCNLTKACSEWQIAAQTCADNAKVADRATEELRKENKELKSKVAESADTISRLSANKVALTEEVGKLRETVADRTIDVQHLTEENAKLKTDLDQRNKDFDAMKKDRDNILADSKRTTEWYMEANRTASEAAEANDELKAKIADLRNRVGEQLAQIQDLNAEIHFHKEFGEGLDKQQKELQARYDELDSVNKEQAEKIRKLDSHNVYLKGLLSAKKKMRIVLNNGNMYDVEVGDKVHPVYDMNNNLFFVKTEGGTVTSFIIGKEPGNIAGWYMV